MKTAENFDVIIAGAGSVGTPVALFLAQAGFKVLVIEALTSPGQASNKHAIGGIRATHSDPSKIYLCQNSIDIFSTWEEIYGDDIDWRAGGYNFVAYDEKSETTLKSLIDQQKSLGLNINWLSKEENLEIAPQLKQNGLLGGTYSPEDGSASPLKAAFAFWQRAQIEGAIFHFNEEVEEVFIEGNRIQAVRTNKETYGCKVFINAAGGWAKQIAKMVGINLPIMPDAHEAGITEPVQPMFNAMIVDNREAPGSNGFYFYQHPTGKIIFCLTPKPQIWGNLKENNSSFLPMACKRLIDVMPVFANIRIRRTWRGTYPMTPDGNPIVGTIDGLDGYINAVGVCGQGFMLGPGLGKLLTNMVSGNLNQTEKEYLFKMRYDRSFDSQELLK